VKISVRGFLFTVSIIGIAASVALIFLLIPGQSVGNLSVKAAAPTIVQAPQYVANIKLAQSSEQIVSQAQRIQGIPIRLKIPRLKIDALIEPVGLTPEGAMGVSKYIANAAWFNLGPRPGEIGSAVIDGHYGWKDDVPAVFDKLHKIRIGDKIYIDDESGVTTTFAVREKKTLQPDDDASSVFSSSDGQAHLNLITCQGAWNETSHSYPDRLVVFSDQVTN